MNEKPRKLTNEEIRDILSVLPNIKSAADTVSSANTKSMKVLVAEQLADIEITPLGIPDLKRELIRQFDESIISPGSMVGALVSESTGKLITQMALNSFHTSGSSKNVSYGVERISELINATNNPKKTSCSVYFKDETLSFDDVITKKRVQFTEITVKDLVIGLPDIESSSKIEEEEPYWYSLFRSIFDVEFESTDVLRLDIDINMLYAYKITMEDVCAAIERDQPVVCVFSPMDVGKIDIYPIEKMITSKLRDIKIVSYEKASLIFLSMIVVPALDKLKISGISGIDQIYPVEAPVWQIVKEEIRIPDFENGWHLILNPLRMKITGISVEKLIKLCQIAGMKILKTRPEYISVTCDMSPTKKILKLIEDDTNEKKAYEKRKKEEGKNVSGNTGNSGNLRRPPSEIAVASKLIYADTTGANLIELLAHPEVDATRTFSNDVHEIYRAFGIEAARSFLIKELIEVIGHEGYVNPRHIVLLVDFMTSLGIVSGVTFSGISRQPIGALEKASFEKAMNIFKEAGGFGEEKSVSGTSASIYIGKRALVGTGYSKDFLKPKNLERYHETRKQLLEGTEMTLDVNSFNDVIENMNVEVSDSIAILEGAEEEMFSKIDFESKPKDLQVPKTPEKEKISATISEKPIVSNTVLHKAKVTISEELNEIANKMLDTTQSCPLPFKTTIPSMPPIMPPISLKPTPQAVKIFDLEEFLK